MSASIVIMMELLLINLWNGYSNHPVLLAQMMVIFARTIFVMHQGIALIQLLYAMIIIPVQPIVV